MSHATNELGKALAGAGCAPREPPLQYCWSNWERGGPELELRHDASSDGGDVRGRPRRSQMAAGLGQVLERSVRDRSRLRCCCEPG